MFVYYILDNTIQFFSEIGVVLISRNNLQNPINKMTKLFLLNQHFLHTNHNQKYE